jgi:phage protein D
MTLNWGKELLSFNPRLSTAKVVSKVTVKGHNQKNPKKPIIGVATLKDIGFKEPKAKSAAESVKTCQKKEVETSEHDFPVCNEDDAKTLAKALLMKANNSVIEGNCECIGIPELRPGTNVQIEGIGKRFSGKYYVKSVKHSIGDGGYTVSFEVRRGGIGTI